MRVEGKDKGRRDYVGQRKEAARTGSAEGQGAQRRTTVAQLATAR